MKLGLCTLVFCLVFLDPCLGRTYDEKKVHSKEKHHHHSRHNSKLIRTRDSNNSSVCLSNSEQELLNLIKWLNGTNELRVIFELTPPSVRRWILGNGTISNTTRGNITILNTTIPVDLDSFYVEQEEFRIFLYFARVFGYVALQNGGGNLVSLGQKLLEAFLRGSGNPQELLKNFENILNSTTSSGGSLGNNFFNFSSLLNLTSPSNFIKGVANVEHAIETGAQNFIGNVSHIFG